MIKHVPHWKPLGNDIVDRKLLMRSKETAPNGRKIISAGIVDSKTGEIKEWFYPNYTPVEYWTF